MKRPMPEMVLDGGLLRALAAIFGMDQLWGGEGVRRDEHGCIVRDDHGRAVLRPVARSLWAAEVRPGHTDPFCLAVVTTAERRMAGLVVEAHPRVAEYPPFIMPIVPPTLVRAGPLLLEAGWDDPVVAALGSLDARPRDDVRVVLDGDAYAFFAGSADAQIALAFSNPRTPSLLALEDGLVQVARMLMAHDPTGTVASYLGHWTG